MSMKKRGLPQWVSDYLKNLSYDEEESISRILKKYPWVSSFLDSLHLSEKRAAATRLISWGGIEVLFAEIEEKLPSYKINFYDEIERKFPQNPSKDAVLAAITDIYREIEGKLACYKTTNKEEILAPIEDIHEHVMENLPLILTKPGVIGFMKKAYPEIEENPDRRIGGYNILAAIIDGAVFCNSQRPVDLNGNSSILFTSTAQKREEIHNAIELRDKIIETSNKLVELIGKFEGIIEKGIAASNSDIDLFHLIKCAARGMPIKRQYSYENYIEPHIRNAEDASNLNLEYYPSLQEILNVVSEEMDANPVYIDRSFIDWSRVLSSRQRSASEFIRFFLVEIEEMKSLYLPDDFDLESLSIATIAESVLGFSKGCTEKNVEQIKKELMGKNSRQKIN